MPTKIIIYSRTGQGKTTKARQLSKDQNIQLFQGEHHDEIMTPDEARQFAENKNPCIATIYGEELESSFFRFKRLLGLNRKSPIPIKMIPANR